MTRVDCTVACAAVVLVTGCGSGDGGQEVGSGPGVSSSATTEAAWPSPTGTPLITASAQPTGDGADCGHAASYEETAKCLYEAFRQQDRQEAGRYATPEAVEDLFALGGFPTDDQWQFDGCDAGRETSPSGGVACHYVIPGEVHPTYVEMAMRDDYVVEQVQSIG